MKKYLLTKWRNKIEEVEVVRETEKCVFIKSVNWGKPCEDKRLKNTDYDKYFDTWEEAYKEAYRRAEVAVDSAEIRLREARANLESVKKMAEGRK